METKKPYLSKTLWINALIAIGAIAYPPASEYIAGHADLVLTVMAALNMVLRLVSKDKISLGE